MTDDGKEVWALMLGEARRENEAGERQVPPRGEPERRQQAEALRDWQRPPAAARAVDEEVPF